MKALLLDIPPGGRFHLGRGSLDRTSELIHADTLVSALAVMMEKVYGEASRMIEAVRTGALRLSSGLPALIPEYRPEAPVFFFPRPPLRYQQNGVDLDPSAFKRLRRIRYISAGLLRKLQESACLPASPDALPTVEWPEESQTMGERFALLPEELGLPQVPEALPSFMGRTLRPHVFVHKENREDALFHTLSVEMRRVLLWHDRKSGEDYRARGTYAIFMEVEEVDLERRVLACLRLLGDEGLGGEGTSGYGQFHDVREVPPPPRREKATYYLSLAPVIPESDEAFRRGVHYDLLLRSGGYWGKIERRLVRMIAEGALFHGKVEGTVVAVGHTGEHPIYRAGKNVAWPLL